jgi:flagellar basal-body rod modification protein FlgD
MASVGSVLGTNPTPSASDTSTTSAAGGTDSLANESTFLQLLVTQLKNQDPTQPMDSTAFLGELAQFSQLEQLVSINQDLTNGIPVTNATPSTSTSGTTPTS